MKGERGKVIICGAGIGGLTVAHELAKHDFDVVLFERNEIIGGLARGQYVRKGKYEYPVEYSWRVFGVGYKNLLQILSEIKLHKSKKTVRDNLIKASTYIFPRFNRKEVIYSEIKEENRTSFSFGIWENLKILNKIFYCTTMSVARMNSLDHVKWSDYCNNLSLESRKYLVKLWGPVLGMDPTNMSFPVVARFVSILFARYTGYSSALYLMNKPINDGWFDEWAFYLKKTGRVDIRTSNEILNFEVENKKITGITVQDKISKKISKQTADYYVCAMSVETIAKIINKNKKLSKFESLKNTIPLAKGSRQIQLSVQFFLEDEIDYPTSKTPILYLPDSPWALIIEPQAMVWGKTYCSNKKVKSILSIGICKTDAKGVLYKKAFTECNEREVREEVWRQIVKSYEFSDIRLKSGESIDEARILKFHMWDSFKFVNKKRAIDTWEPKFGNNSGSFQYQPNTETELENFFFATGYTKTDRFIYSMESAAEAGIACSNTILERSDLHVPKKHIHSFKTSIWFLMPLIWIDRLLFEMGMPHVGKVISSILLIAIYLGLIIYLTYLLLISFL